MANPINGYPEPQTLFRLLPRMALGAQALPAGAQQAVAGAVAAQPAVGLCSAGAVWRALPDAVNGQ